MCILCQTPVGYIQGCVGAEAGMLRLLWHSLHDAASFSKSRSIPGHHTKLRATPFILTMPKCPLWSSSKILPRNLEGNTILIPHIRQSFHVESSAFLLKNGARALSWPRLHPSLTIVSTFPSIGSRLVSRLISSFVTGKHSRYVSVKL